MIRRPWPRATICESAPSNGRRHKRRTTDWAAADEYPTPIHLLQIWAVIEEHRLAGER